LSNRRNYYRILYAQPDAPLEVIKANYRTLMQKLRVHPDIGGDDWNASLLNAAYATLRDERRRASYDQKLLARYDIAVLSGGGRPIAARPTRTSHNRRNYYRILQIQPCAPAPLVEASYRAIKNTGNPPAAVVEQAYRTLRDPVRRGAYDAALFGEATVTDGAQTTLPSARPNTVDSATTARARPGSTGYEPLISGYCAFCKTPHRHGPRHADGARCVECDSPLAPSSLDHFNQSGRTLDRMRGHDPIAYYVYWPGARLRGHIRDLSPTGMRFSTQYPLPPGHVIKIEASRFEAVGKGIHAHTRVGCTDVGIKFVTIQFAARRGTFLSARV